MDLGNAPRSEEKSTERHHHHDAKEEIQALYQSAIQERDDLREYVRQLEQQVLPRFDVNGTNLVGIFVSQKDAYLDQVKILEKAAVDAEKAHGNEFQRLQRHTQDLQRQYDEIKEQTFGKNGYRDRLQSTHVALELSKMTCPPDAVGCVEQLAELTRERDESNRQVLRLQEEKIEWEQERLKLEGRTAELALRVRTLEDILGASESVNVSGVFGYDGPPVPRREVLGDAVWRRWSDRLWDHIQVQPEEVEAIYALASANQQSPGVTGVKQLVDLACNRPVAPLVEEDVWRQWANGLQDFILTGSNEAEKLYRLGDQEQLTAGVEWIRQLIRIASDRPTSPDQAFTIREYQLSVQLKEAQTKIEELQMVGTGGQQADSQAGHLIFNNKVLEKELQAANARIEELLQEMEGITARFEDEIEQLERKLKESYEQQDLLKRLYESGQAHKDKLIEIEQSQKELKAAHDRENNLKGLYDKQKELSDEHEEVWQQKFDKVVAGADRHAAELVEEAETLQGRLDGAHGVIAELEKKVDTLREQITQAHIRGSEVKESVSGVAAEEGRQGAADSHGSESESESENENDVKDPEEGEKSESEELKTVKTDLYNTLKEVEELKLKLGFADCAFDDMKEEFEVKITQLENNTKEAMMEKECMAEKLRQALEIFKRGVAAEVRRLEREGRLKLRTSWTQTDRLEGEDRLFTGKRKVGGRKILAPPKAKKPATIPEPKDHTQSPPLFPLESPQHSPDTLTKGDGEFRAPRVNRKARNKRLQNDESDAESEGAVGTRRSARATRNLEPVYREVPMKVLLAGRRSTGGRKRKAEEGVEGARQAGENLDRAEEPEREEAKRVKIL
ncbi:hypothetical protein DSL72_005011 [Monilinia vaccinii-corymbosi]|uniref:Uncharacterized protein n=1 Tax=Monilinia vaccinii-corymbosi TaxID=61207 RepID=A0A8A3PEF2_9HELO|nr:hypothetical protein DSL72_005011 [Monilinia vaccinii-corymbosi]